MEIAPVQSKQARNLQRFEMKKCKRISTIISGRWLSFFAVTVLALALIIPTAAKSATAVDLGAAGNYVILAQSGITTTGTSAITGDLGLSSSASSYTGFGLIMDADSAWSTSSIVTGKIYAFDYADPTPTNLTTAVGDMGTAYTDANSRAVDFNNLYAGDISGQTLAPGVYKYTTALLINTQVTFDAGDDTNAVWIFQVDQNVAMASNISVILANGAQAQNIFWALAGQMDIGTNSHFEGIVLSYTAINFQTAASFNGRALAQTAVTLDAK
ncbi:MAG: ice-binding family protein [Candidatus Marinimicrobia bacterium]|nr:ice-binding family protein [Candidatus Neomarinimicrobiota bacterium]